MEGAEPNPAAFFHVRVIIGIVTGLSVARLLNGLARFVQHPAREQVYGVHLGWSLFLLLAVVHFWWFEFALAKIGRWTFEQYLFVLGYAALFFFVSAILYPDKMEEYRGFESYFHARQKWFYGLFAAIFLVDIADTALKGADHFRSLGPYYPIRQTALASLALAAIWIRRRSYHMALVAIALATQLWLIFSQFEILD